MRLRIKSMILNIRKQKTSNQNNKKENESPAKNEDSDISLMHNFKWANIHTIGVPEGEEKSL